jgi:hypothetical protein
MAIRKASDSNLTGKKYNDASAGATKIADIPNTPATPTSATADAPSVAFTPAATGGSATNYVVGLGVGNTTWSGASSPISATGLTPGTSVTFKVKAVNSTGESAFSSTSTSVSVTGWALAETFNSSTNWTVPVGVTKIGVAVISGGAGGTQGNHTNSVPGPGGSSGSAVSFWDQAVNANTTYAVTVGGAGGNSAFGSLASATSGGNATSNVNTNKQIVNAAGGGSSNTINAQNYQFNAASGGGASTSLVLSIPTNGPYTVLHGGGGGGASDGGTSGGNSYGGAGASGFGQGIVTAGQAGRGPGGGGGGSTRTAGAAGAGGRIYVYTYTAS